MNFCATESTKRIQNSYKSLYDPIEVNFHLVLDPGISPSYLDAHPPSHLGFATSVWSSSPPPLCRCLLTLPSSENTLANTSLPEMGT